MTKLGPIGAWQPTEALSAPDAGALARRIEAWGYGAIWIPEAVGRNALVHSAWLLAQTTTLTVATGIANIYARDPVSAQGAGLTLAEQSGGRFVLGLGVSHAPMVEGMRRQTYKPPIATMRAYLEAMAKAMYMAPRPAEPAPVVIGALGPKMMELSRDLADGAHPYHQPPEHTAISREILGPGKLLCPEQPVLLETDPAKARATARASLGMYIALDNYRNNWQRLGFTTDDFENGGSDRFIDAIVAWGDEDAIRARIKAHHDAGADHVCIQALTVDGPPMGGVAEKTLALLAPAKS